MFEKGKLYKTTKSLVFEDCQISTNKRIQNISIKENSILLFLKIKPGKFPLKEWKIYVFLYKNKIVSRVMSDFTKDKIAPNLFIKIS